MPVTLLGWREVRKNALRGFAEIRVGALVISEVGVFRMGDKMWAAMPARPRLQDGRVMLNNSSRPVYESILRWEGREATDRFSAGVCAAVEAAHPEALRDDDALA